MTLHQLKRNWTRAVRPVPLGFSPEGFIQHVEGWQDEHGNFTPPNVRVLQHIENVEAIYRAAKLYVIARDEGLDIAMLWKLSQS